MEELDVKTIAKRSVNGVVALISRTFIIQLISLLLTVFLSPSIYGVFFVVSAIIPFLSYFSDIGLAAALVQKKEPVTDDDLKTTFTIQQTLVVTIVVIAFLLSDKIATFYRLEAVGIQLFQALVIAFFLSSLKTIPSVLLERHLHFRKLVFPQIVETFLFNITILILVLKGFGVASFTYAVLVRGMSGLLIIYIIAPWMPKIGFSKKSAKKLLSFGIPFQINSILALLKDDLLIIYLGRVLPLAQ
ncbi:MAG: oligosaccharide flippase family protein, partial [bacterium]|nr:oligosaccharide flippase family protein [bacterium]